MRPRVYDFLIALARDCVSIIISGFGAHQLPDGPVAGTPCKTILLSNSGLEVVIRTVTKAKVREIKSELPPLSSKSGKRTVSMIAAHRGHFPEAIRVEGTACNGATVFTFDATVTFDDKEVLIDELVEFLAKHCPDASYFIAAFVTAKARYRYEVTRGAKQETDAGANYRLLGA